MTKKIFFNGCSFTDSCGFTEINHRKYHWTWLIADHYQTHFCNVASIGSPNDEIFYRTMKNCHATKYDLVIIMWSGLDRKWAYQSDNNVDDVTVLTNGHKGGFYSDKPWVTDYARLYYTYFNNQYIATQNWLSQLITLASFFNDRNQPYLYLKGFDNRLSALDRASFVPGEGFRDLPSDCRQILDFDQRPDHYINSKLSDLKSLINCARNLNWIDFDRLGFFEQRQDTADDALHPGPVSNRVIAEKIMSYCNKHKLL